MIRTRDFFLFLVVAGFLVVAITVTVVWNYRVHIIASIDTVQFDTTTASYTASVATIPDTKSDRLVALRKKLAEDTSISAPETPTEPVISETPTTTETVTVPAENKILLCDKAYTPKTIHGLTGLQLYKEGEGQRIFYTTSLSVVDIATTTPPQSVETVVFTLPLRTLSLDTQSCIKDDVVAISPTGVLIRNDDYAKYQGSGESTLIGYTLDGFPLYGRTNSIATDACGGAMVDGSYRYYLSAERKGVIGCFAAIPVAI